jgi:hypothetical protein
MGLNLQIKNDNKNNYLKIFFKNLNSQEGDQLVLSFLKHLFFPSNFQKFK